MLENNDGAFPLVIHDGACRQVHRGASTAVDAAAHLHLPQRLLGFDGGWEVVVGQHGVGVPHLVINAAGVLATLNMGQRNVLVGRGNRDGQGFVPVCDD